VILGFDHCTSGAYSAARSTSSSLPSPVKRGRTTGRAKRGRIVFEHHAFCFEGERAGMFNQQPLHDEAGQTQDIRFIVAALGISAEGLDFDQRQVELVHQQGGLPTVLDALAAHL